jgi:hypothetical protein
MLDELKETLERMFPEGTNVTINAGAVYFWERGFDKGNLKLKLAEKGFNVTIHSDSTSPLIRVEINA